MFGSSRKKIMKLDSQQRKGLSLISKLRPKSVIAEQYRIIRTNIQFSMIDRDVKSIVMTSSGPWEGKSTTSANLASVFTDQGKWVLLVDADLRKPTVQRTFGLSNIVGLTTLLSSPEQELTEVIQQVTGTDLYVLTSGPIPPNPSELLNSNRMNILMKRFEDMFDIIIYDMPPVTSVTDAQIMAAKADGVVFVIRHGVSHKDSVLNAKELLEMVNANILGVVFNGVEKKTDYSYYGYGYTNEGEAE
ncbi:capsular exopolysaccharide family [Trichococcus flocculiformis]|uniref:CpsD/CapB family tyrosine-protein kinase n=1 Tax=Trichococcus TaxID=82802 RepID=UPI0007A8563B|nr:MULTISPECIES: CpsD/CapB family tyrosine-protein kinase [Trichococcus]CZQ85002.1 exopolysaccharide synthesis protein [Trichococcus sp. ES5]SHG22132.1 capsular exopolysaccharide family [Trichococcus flocculiformis]